jgi:hypothetical protein
MYVNLTFKVLWQFKDFPHYKVTKCKKVINCKINTLLKYTTRGFYIDGKYYKRSDLKDMIEKIPKKEYCPF